MPDDLPQSPGDPSASATATAAPAAPNPETVSAPDPPVTVEEDTFCLGCGYNLRGLAMQGRCPECGVSVAESADKAAALRGASRAVTLAVWSGLLGMSGLLASTFLVRDRAPNSFVSAVLLPAWVVMYFACRRISDVGALMRSAELAASVRIWRVATATSVLASAGLSALAMLGGLPIADWVGLAMAAANVFLWIVPAAAFCAAARGLAIAGGLADDARRFQRIGYVVVAGFAGLMLTAAVSAASLFGLLVLSKWELILTLMPAVALVFVGTAAGVWAGRKLAHGLARIADPDPSAEE